MDRGMREMGRATWLLALVALAGCELVVDFDRDRIVDDMGADMAMDDEDMGTPPEEDMGSADEDMGAADEDMGAAEDMGVESDMFAETDMFEGDAFMCSGPGDCDDSVSCTVDECTSGVCSNTPDDGMCDDSNACTTDVCDMTSGCGSTNVCVLDVNSGALTADDLTTVLTIPSVTAGADGFLVVFESDGTTELGFAAVSAGTSNDVDVELTRELVDAEMVVVGLFEDAGTIGTWEPGTDLQANDGTDDVEATVTVTVSAGTPAVEVTIRGNGAGTHYTFSGARPSTFATELASLTGNDPSIVLVRGLRYRFVNETPSAHPFELVTDGGGGADTVQLAQGTDVGALETDLGIGWSDVGGAVEATVTGGFETDIDTYRCGIHTADMRGAISYMD